MSWSVSAQGTKEQVAEAAERGFASCADMYPSETSEGKDVLAARTRALELLADLSLEPDGGAPNGYDAYVSCYGSHDTWDSRLAGAELHVNVGRLPKQP